MREDELIERAVTSLREPVRVDPALDARVMAGIARLPAPRPEPAWRSAAARLVRGHSIRLTPLSALAAAAAIVLMTLVGQQWMGSGPSTPSAPPAVAAGTPFAQFVVVIPGAQAVSLVGDFNDWDESATPMAPRGADGIWSVTVPLAPGRYQYSFLVDGVTWVADPGAPRALEDDFGRPNSVVTVGGS
jgi:hypothetical protein